MAEPNTLAACSEKTPGIMTCDSLANVAMAFGLLSRVFWEEPQDGIVETLAASQSTLAASPLAVSIAPLGFAHLLHALESFSQNSAAQMVALKQDRAYLFYEIGYSRTSPYESAYRTPDRTLFGPTTAQVKQDYERHGLAPALNENAPSDHFALECAYIQQIAQAGISAANDGDEAAYTGACHEIRRFLGAHMLVFGPVYLQNVTKRASTVFYRSLGEMALEILSWAQKLTGAQPSEVLDIADFPLKVRRAGKEY